MKTLLSMLLTVSLFLTGCEKARIDQQVKELCAKDGGVRVYETVKLPADRFDQWGMIKAYDPTRGEGALGSGYIFKRNTTYLRQGNPDMLRIHTQVIRRIDNKILGESVFYKRGGGDPPGPWHGSSLMCPELSVENDVLRQIFIKD